MCTIDVQIRTRRNSKVSVSLSEIANFERKKKSLLSLSQLSYVKKLSFSLISWNYVLGSFMLPFSCLVWYLVLWTRFRRFFVFVKNLSHTHTHSYVINLSFSEKFLPFWRSLPLFLSHTLHIWVSLFFQHFSSFDLKWCLFI